MNSPDPAGGRSYIEASDANGRLVMERLLAGPVAMLNLLQFRSVADYSAFPDLAPAIPISGRAAYDLYMRHTMPFLEAAGGKVLFTAVGGHYLIGPVDEVWDMAILVEHASLQALMDMANNPEYMAGMGHRTAALADSRLLPLELDQSLA